MSIVTLHINGLMHQPKEIDWLSRCKHVHVCASTYHITVLEPPKFYVYIVNHITIMACNCNYLLVFVWLLIVKTDKHLLLL